MILESGTFCFVFWCNYYFASGRVVKRCDHRVCLSAVKNHISIFTNSSIRITCGRGSVLL